VEEVRASIAISGMPTSRKRAAVAESSPHRTKNTVMGHMRMLYLNTQHHHTPSAYSYLGFSINGLPSMSHIVMSKQ